VLQRRAIITRSAEDGDDIEVAEHFEMERDSMLVCFDHPRRKKHILISDTGKTALRKAAQERIMEIALATVLKHAAKNNEEQG